MNYFATLFLAVLMFGCAAPGQKSVSRMPFPEAEYLALSKTGTAIVKGQAFLKTRGGDVKTAAGNQVHLNPVTSYSLEWHEKSYLSNLPLEGADRRIEAYLKTQTADGNGRFTFKNVPAGEYFVTTDVMWESPTGYQGALQVQGGTVTKRIVVSEGEEVEVIVTR